MGVPDYFTFDLKKMPKYLGVDFDEPIETYYLFTPCSKFKLRNGYNLSFYRALTNFSTTKKKEIVHSI